MDDNEVYKQNIKADKALCNYTKSGKGKRSNWLNRIAEIRQEEENTVCKKTKKIS